MNKVFLRNRHLRSKQQNQDNKHDKMSREDRIIDLIYKIFVVRWCHKVEGVIEPPLVMWSIYSNLQTMNGSSFDEPADSKGLEYTFMAVRKRP